ncbi:hypothetical protein [Embleya sp. NBC_00896]|uniref:hypothetical protein n=1 Tax=Embleya sp. NBC_00896 TaxID=2975961 RepID=UPI00386325A0|nr:transposase [Embleya sp. NBC_00896]
MLLKGYQRLGYTNRAEAFHGFSDWLKEIIKFNELLANCVIYSNACAITASAANSPAAEGHPVDLAMISPCIAHTIRRFGGFALDLTPPDTRLDLAPGALFPTGRV